MGFILVVGEGCPPQGACIRKLPPLHALRAFEAAARHGHFARAADELHRTPTAISHQVRHLEAILGVELFHRRPRPLRLSPEGERLFPVLREALDRIAAEIDQITADTRSAPLRLSVTMAFASRWLMPRLPDLRDRTGISAAIEADDCPVDLHASGVDMAIRYAGKAGEDGEWHRLFPDRIVPVCAPHAIAGPPPLSPRAILGMPLLHYGWKSANVLAPSWGRWQIAALIDGPPPRIGQFFSEEVHALDAALAGQGAVLASERLVMDALRAGTLLRLSDISLPGLSYWAVSLPGHPAKERLNALRDWFAQRARSD